MFDTFLRQIHQFTYTLLAFPRASRFIRTYRLWAGMKEYKWVYRFVLLVAALAGLYLVAEFLNYTETHAEATITQSVFSADGFISQIGFETYESMTDGALKWVILILLEVVIYHFMRQSLKIVANKDVEDAHKFKPFADAQARMIGVSFMAYGLEIALTEVFAGVVFGIFGPIRFLEPAFVLLVQCSLLGFAIVDNYNEQYGLKVGQSFRYTRMGYIGVCLGVGVPLYFILKIPFIGAVIGPIVASVVVAIVMYELSDLATVGYVPSKKEQAKIDKKAARKAKKLARSKS